MRRILLVLAVLAVITAMLSFPSLALAIPQEPQGEPDEHAQQGLLRSECASGFRNPVVEGFCID